MPCAHALARFSARATLHTAFTTKSGITENSAIAPFDSILMLAVLRRGEEGKRRRRMMLRMALTANMTRALMVAEYEKCGWDRTKCLGHFGEERDSNIAVIINIGRRRRRRRGGRAAAGRVSRKKKFKKMPLLGVIAVSARNRNALLNTTNKTKTWELLT